MTGSPRVVALLLSGGGGTRLWPVSTAERPKQFLALFGERSLYQLTLARLRVAAIDDVVVMGNAAHEAYLLGQSTEIGVTPLLILEPMRRDSAAAIAAGVAAIRSRFGDDAVITVLPCDHLIPDETHFARTLREGIALAQLGYLGTFGIKPTAPSTEFGYIQRGAALPDHGNAHAVAKFHEKPPADRAAAYVADESYAWNSGMFVFTAATFAREAERHMPDIWHAVNAAVARGGESDGHHRLDAAAFAQASKISIDHALFEKSDKVAVVPATFGWSDVGNWSAVRDAMPADLGTGNTLVGPATVRDGWGNLVLADGVRVVVIGLQDFVVAASPTGVFIAPASRAAEVKALIEALPAAKGSQ